MTLSQALGLGVLQGVTEFLPVSSSGHLILARLWLPAAPGEPELLYDVVAHLGTLAAIALVLRARLLGLLRAAATLPGGRRAAKGMETERRWLGLILAGSIPTAVIGLALRGTVETMHAHPASVGAALLATAVLLFFSERRGRRERGAADLGLADALVIGVAQGFGVLPGLSRSGSTVAAALWRDVRGQVAVEFSILLSVPAVIGANLLEIGEAGIAAVSAAFLPLLVGFGAAFVTGTLALKALQCVVTGRRLLPFAAYCAVVGGGAMFLG